MGSFGYGGDRGLTTSGAFILTLKISDEAKVQMPMKTVASLIALVSIGTWAYFGIIETQNRITTQFEIMNKDLEMNTEFRIKWPRGMLGALPADQEQFMMIEDLYKTTDRIAKAIEDGMHNKVNIEFLTKQMNKVQSDIEKLKDKQRTFSNGNGVQ